MFLFPDEGQLFNSNKEEQALHQGKLKDEMKEVYQFCEVLLCGIQKEMFVTIQKVQKWMEACNLYKQITKEAVSLTVYNIYQISVLTFEHLVENLLI